MSKTGEAPGRYTWIDAGRGVAIVLVTLYHAVNWSHGAGFDSEWWTRINATVASLRMPLFFTISGVLGYPWLAREWRSLIDRKILLFVWVFLLWEAISSLVFFLVMVMNGNRTTILRLGLELTWTPIFPRFELWFIWVLAIAFVVAKLTRRVWWPAQLVLAAAVSWFAFSQAHAPNVGWLGMGKYYLFFIGGMYLRDAILAFEQRVRLSITVGLVVGFVAFGYVLNTGVLTSTTLPVALADSWEGGLFLLAFSVLGTLTGVVLSRYLAGWRMLRHLGANTLPIYVCHTPVIMLCAYALFRLDVPADGPAWLAAVVPPVLTVLAIVICLRVKAVSNLVAPWLFEAPLWLRTVVMSLWRSRSPVAPRHRHTSGDQRPPA